MRLIVNLNFVWGLLKLLFLLINRTCIFFCASKVKMGLYMTYCPVFVASSLQTYRIKIVLIKVTMKGNLKHNRWCITYVPIKSAKYRRESNATQWKNELTKCFNQILSRLYCDCKSKQLLFINKLTVWLKVNIKLYRVLRSSEKTNHDLNPLLRNRKSVVWILGVLTINGRDVINFNNKSNNVNVR